MLNSELSYKETKYFNSLFCDYLDTKDVLKEFYNNTPELNSFKDQIIEKQSNYDPKFREKLKNIILKQYSCIEINDKLKNTIHSLTDINTFTITTGHQLCLFTGPLYFIYKILTTINLTQKLKDNYPKYNFLPVYWMATEDHDFEEIKSFNFQNSNLYFNSIEKVTTPTLVMGGEKDWNVPIQNSEQIYQALRRMGVPTQLIVYPGQPHGLRIPSYQKDRLERYLAWYDKWLKGTETVEKQ